MSTTVVSRSLLLLGVSLLGLVSWQGMQGQQVGQSEFVAKPAVGSAMVDPIESIKPSKIWTTAEANAQIFFPTVDKPKPKVFKPEFDFLALAEKNGQPTEVFFKYRTGDKRMVALAPGTQLIFPDHLGRSIYFDSVHEEKVPGQPFPRKYVKLRVGEQTYRLYQRMTIQNRQPLLISEPVQK